MSKTFQADNVKSLATELTDLFKKYQVSPTPWCNELDLTDGSYGYWEYSHQDNEDEFTLEYVESDKTRIAALEAENLELRRKLEQQRTSKPNLVYPQAVAITNELKRQLGFPV